jgi:hypothetical protein
MGKLYLLFEAASGYAIFRVVEAEDVASGTTAVQSSWGDFHRFASIVKLRAFEPYVSADQALEDVSAVSENRVSVEVIAKYNLSVHFYFNPQTSLVKCFFAVYNRSVQRAFFFKKTKK